MARRENPIDPADGALAALAYDLRQLRSEADLTYRQMAERCELVASTLSQAASGRHLPSWSTMTAYVLACGGRPADWWERHQSACREHTVAGVATRPAIVVDVTAHRAAVGGVSPAPDPLVAANPREYVYALIQLRAWAGQPSLREIAARSDGMLPHTTIHNMLTRTTLPRRDVVIHFLAACGMDDKGPWLKAWTRLASATSSLAHSQFTPRP